MKRLAVIIPWSSPFMYTYPAVNMMNWERPDGYDIKFFIGSGHMPASRHNDGVEKALAWEADYIMFNGADHLCQKDILLRMFSRMEEYGCDIVQASPPSRGICEGADGVFRQISYRVAKPIRGDNPAFAQEKGTLEVVPTDQGPQEVHVCGTGNILMKAGIFSGLKKPYFQEFISDRELLVRLPIMDSSFTGKCTTMAGAKMIFDPDIEITHLDLFVIDKTYSERFKDKTSVPGWTNGHEVARFL